MTKKLTKREMFVLVRAAIDTHPAVPEAAKESMLAFVDHEVELLSRKRKDAKGDAKKAAEQKEAMGRIADALADADEGMRAGDIAKVTGDSVQRVTAMLKKMVDSGEVVRTDEKKVATFTLAE